MTCLRAVAVIGLAPWHLCAANCIDVDGLSIRARDLQRALPGFVPRDLDQILALSPLPGIERTFFPRDLAKIAKEVGVFTNADDIRKPVCFKSRVRTLGAVEIQEAVARRLGIEAYNIEVIKFTKALVPPGSIDFNLPSPAKGPATRYVYGIAKSEEGRSYPIWAQVRAEVEMDAVFPKAHLPRGHQLKPADLQVRRTLYSLFSQPLVANLYDASGRTLATAANPDQPILLAALEPLKLVHLGETVQISATFGNAELRFSGVAEGSGSKGDRIVVRNPLNGKTFQGVVTEAGRVKVDLGKKG